MNEQQFKHLLQKYLDGKATKDESQQVEIFLDSFQQKNSSQKISPDELKTLEPKLLSNIHEAVQAQQKPLYLSGRRLFTSVAAAVLLLVLSLVVVYQLTDFNNEQAQIVKTTKKGEKLSLVLPDGTKVKLNAESSISYPQEFSQQNRTIELRGEAFFDVVKNPNKPFIIHSGPIKTTVLGTSFNINAFEDQNAKVTVATGLVKVETQSEAGVEKKMIEFLEPNEQAVFVNKSKILVAREVPTEQYIAWRKEPETSDSQTITNQPNNNQEAQQENQTITFDHISLAEAAIQLEKVFQVTIIFKNNDMKDCRIRSTYQDAQLTNILMSLEAIYGLEYQIIDEKTVMLTGGSCL